MSPEPLTKAELEFAELETFANFYWTHVLGIAPETPTHPCHGIRWLRENLSAKRSLAGLRQAFNDSVASLLDLPASKLQEIDLEMQAAGLRPLSHFIDTHSRQLERILRRHRLRNDTEYYLVSEILTDTTRTMSVEDRCTMERLVSEFRGHS